MVITIANTKPKTGENRSIDVFQTKHDGSRMSGRYLKLPDFPTTISRCKSTEELQGVIISHPHG